jgi:hypothetical protein
VAVSFACKNEMNLGLLIKALYTPGYAQGGRKVQGYTKQQSVPD